MIPNVKSIADADAVGISVTRGVMARSFGGIKEILNLRAALESTTKNYDTITLKLNESTQGVMQTIQIGADDQILRAYWGLFCGSLVFEGLDILELLANFLAGIQDVKIFNYDDVHTSSELKVTYLIFVSLDFVLFFYSQYSKVSAVRMLYSVVKSGKLGIHVKTDEIEKLTYNQTKREIDLHSRLHQLDLAILFLSTTGLSALTENVPFIILNLIWFMNAAEEEFQGTGTVFASFVFIAFTLSVFIGGMKLASFAFCQKAKMDRAMISKDIKNEEILKRQVLQNVSSDVSKRK